MKLIELVGLLVFGIFHLKNVRTFFGRNSLIGSVNWRNKKPRAD